jgi:hypothetical protein
MTASTESTQKVTFPRLILRILFVAGLVALLSAPQLLSETPSSFFETVGDFLRGLTWWQWAILFLVIAGLAWLLTIPSRQGGGGAAEAAAARLPISEAVDPANGGNGLVTAPYSPILRRFGLMGWVEIKDAGKECVVLDGRRVLRQTTLLAAPSRLIGRPISARRVLLQPAPLTDVSAASTTADKLNLTMVVSAKYEVLDPIYTASLQAPLKELADLLAGAVRNYVPSESLESILLNEGQLNECMRERISESPTIAGKYRIVEILKAMPTGDQRIIEIINQTREAIQRRALIEQEGENRKLAAEADLAIQQKFKEQEDQFMAREHERQLEIVRLKDAGETQRQMLQMIGAIAAAGVVDLPRAIEALSHIRGIYAGSVQLPAPSQSTASLPAVDAERRALAEISGDLGIRSFTVEPRVDDPSQPGSAWLGFDNYNVLVDCPEGYPSAAPIIRVQTGTSSPERLGIPWVPGYRIANAIISSAAQLPLTGMPSEVIR